MKQASAGKKVFAVLALAAMGLAVFAVLPGSVSGQSDDDFEIEPEGGELYPVSDYGWLTLYMHQVYERYNKAKEYFDKGDMELAEANLLVMEMFTEASKKHLPDTLQDGKPFDKKAYNDSIDKLNAFSAEIRKNLKDKKWADVPEDKLDPMMQTCVGCHAAYNIPTDFRIDNKFKSLTHIMHQVYDIYRVAGQLLENKEWDKALYCFKVVAPYIEEIPENIPDTNQDGEKVDKELFIKVYKQLKQFNDDKLKKLETKSFMGGKPLPPPRIVVDNCKVCHANSKIDPPW